MWDKTATTIHQMREDWEMILTCAKAYVDLIGAIPKAPEVTPAPAPAPVQEKAPEPEKQPNKRKIVIDKGKLMALKEAGWTNEKCAEEFHCSVPVIAKALKEIRDNEAKPM